MEQAKKINMSHGSGGQMSAELMKEVFGKHFSNDILDKLEDGAVLSLTGDNPSVVVSTDSFVVTPIEFNGGDIGKLAVCGTVNDVLMMGAIPKYITCAFILEEGLEIATLERIVESMAKTSSKANVKIIAGDTKVVEKRSGKESGESGLMINTTGIGVQRAEKSLERSSGNSSGNSSSNSRGSSINSSGNSSINSRESSPGKIIMPSASKAQDGDAIIISGNLGDHHACILSARMGIENGIKSDCADLSPLVSALYENDVEIHTMRDVTRGGLGTVLNEIASSSAVKIELDEETIPVDAEVRAFCGIMGLDPLYMGNEGKFILIVPSKEKEQALEALRKIEIGRNATYIGDVSEDSEKKGQVIIKTKIGGSRRVDMLFGEGLPRIC